MGPGGPRSLPAVAIHALDESGEDRGSDGVGSRRGGRVCSPGSGRRGRGAALVNTPHALRPAILPRPTVTVGAARQALAATLVVAVVGVALSYVGPRRPTVASVAPAELKVLDYNIHEIFNVWSVPDPEAVARVIEQSGADLVGLQEVGRGWNINGGPDLVAWLRWRFPQSRVIFTPLLGDLVGIAILSRYPVRETGSLRYTQRKSRLPYGLQWATIPTAAGDLSFINTHLSPYPGFEQDRLPAAHHLPEVLLGRGRDPRVG